MRSHRTLGSTYDPKKVEQAVKASLSIEFQQYFPVGELQQVNSPFGPIFTDALEPVDPTDCERWPSSLYCQQEDKADSDNWKVRTIDKVKETLVSKWIRLSPIVPIQFYQDGCLGFITINTKVGPFAMPTMTIAKWDYDECGDPPFPPNESVPPPNRTETVQYVIEQRIDLEGTGPFLIEVKLTAVSRATIASEFGDVPEEIRTRISEKNKFSQAVWVSGNSSSQIRRLYHSPIYLRKSVTKTLEIVESQKTSQEKLGNKRIYHTSKVQTKTSPIRESIR